MTVQRFLALFVLILGAVWIGVTRADPAVVTEGRIPAPRADFLAPDFQLTTLSGEEIQLSDLRGRAVLLNLWASWCPPCKAEMPALQKVWEEYEQKGLVILAVNVTSQDTLPQVAAFIEAYQLTFPVLLDQKGSVAALYEMRSLPTTFFIRSDGMIQEVVVGGPLSEALLRIRAEQLLASSSSSDVLAEETP